MNQTNNFLVEHAGAAVFLTIFAEQIGVPVPAAPVLVAAGALVADGVVNPIAAIAWTILGCLVADLIWFYIGRKSGTGFFRFLQRFSLSNEDALERNQRFFARHGMAAVVWAKFVPGLSLLLPPMAGAFKIRTARFVWFDALGALFYGLAYLALGYLFSEQVNELMEALGNIGVGAAAVGIAVVLIFLGQKFVRQRRSAKPDADTAAPGEPATAIN